MKMAFTLHEFEQLEKNDSKLEQLHHRSIMNPSCEEVCVSGS